MAATCDLPLPPALVTERIPSHTLSAIARILDANVNRAREAMRVMEDAARFALNDEALSAEVKSLRHDLRAALTSLPEGWLEANRDTPGDVGTAISSESEMSRANLPDVVIAAGKRLTEAFRVIEEVGKTIDAGLGREIESLRYRAYDLDQRLVLRLGSGRAKQWRLCLLLTKATCARPWRDVLEGAMRGGVDCVQVREKQMDGDDFAAHVREVISLARPRGVCVIVNDRADIALAAGADGVHLGQSDVSVRDVRRIAGRSLLVGVSTHDLTEAERAVADGADYCGVGAMFASSTKERETSGVEYLRAFVERFPGAPHLAIGGINVGNVSQVVQAGARGVAISAAICAADDPQLVARSLSDEINAARPASSSLRASDAASLQPLPTVHRQ
jgi:thiamine-phosphate pyrophosphorylase